MAKKHVSKQALQKSFHLSGPAKPGERNGKGCVTKCYEGTFNNDDHGNYRYHGYNETKKTPTKKDYYEPSARRLKAFPLKRELLHGMKKKTSREPRDPSNDGWGFHEKKNAKGQINYQNGNVPFPHQYHHMVPWETLGSGVFTTEELKLLQMSEYCLHDGFNLIILPMRARVAEILRMHTHPNNHKKYNIDLENQIWLVKGALCGGDPAIHVTEETAPFMKRTLEDWEEREWKKIMESGSRKYPEHVNEHTPSDMLPSLCRKI